MRHGLDARLPDAPGLPGAGLEAAICTLIAGLLHIETASSILPGRLPVHTIHANHPHESSTQEVTMTTPITHETRAIPSRTQGAFMRVSSALAVVLAQAVSATAWASDYTLLAINPVAGPTLGAIEFLTPWNGRLYSAYSETENGPAFITSFDPTTRTFSQPYQAGTKYINQMTPYGNQLFASSGRPNFSTNDGCTFVADAAGNWTPRVFAKRAMHCYDIKVMGTDIFAFGSGPEDESPNIRGVVWRSTDGGLTFNRSYDPVMNGAPYVANRCYIGGVLQGRLYTQEIGPYGQDYIAPASSSRVFTPSTGTWDVGPSLYPAGMTIARGYNVNNYLGKLVYLSHSPVRDYFITTDYRVNPELITFDGTQASVVPNMPSKPLSFVVDGVYLYTLGMDNLVRRTTDLVTWTTIGTAPNVARCLTIMNGQIYLGGSDAGYYVLGATPPPANQPPVARTTATPTSGTAPVSVAFNASSSSDADGSIVSYAWSFGDGATGSGASISHTYAAAGSYTARVTVTDNAGATGTTTVSITVTAPPAGNQPPVARVSATPTSGTAPVSVAFDGSTSSDPDGSIASYAWNFGDGTTGSGASSSHTYSAAGSYTARLTVTDNGGASASSTIAITVAAAPPAATGPIASWNFDEASGQTAVDATGNGHTGTLSSDVARVAGQPGSAAGFNGATGQVSVPDFDPPTSLTMEAWIYPGQASGQDRIIINKHNSEYDFRIDPNGKLSGQVGGVSLSDPNFDFGSAANADTWYHVAYTFDAATKVHKLYRNGVQVASAGNTATISNQATQLRIGRHSQFDFGTFLGRIDTVRIYARALAASEVSAEAQQGVRPGLIARWLFNENAGSTANDASGNNHVGSVSGASWTPGRSGSGLAFNGSTGYVGVADLAPPTSLTLEAWINPGQGSGADRIIVNKHNSEYDFRIDPNGKLSGQVGGVSLTDPSFDFGSAANAGRWYHVAYTFDANARIHRLYRDGVLVASAANTSAISDQSTQMRIGRHSQFDFGTFLGSIDDVSIYDRALDPAEVQADAQIPASASSL
ncbi:MAG: PKD domain-containing protein, partial [Planctomycetes bacterium]|nr:PKD domain-containing protein [Planctomycetota bacterium]